MHTCIPSVKEIQTHRYVSWGSLDNMIELCKIQMQSRKVQKPFTTAVISVNATFWVLEIKLWLFSDLVMSNLLDQAPKFRNSYDVTWIRTNVSLVNVSCGDTVILSYSVFSITVSQFFHSPTKIHSIPSSAGCMSVESSHDLHTKIITEKERQKIYIKSGI